VTVTHRCSGSSSSWVLSVLLMITRMHIIHSSTMFPRLLSMGYLLSNNPATNNDTAVVEATSSLTSLAGTGSSALSTAGLEEHINDMHASQHQYNIDSKYILRAVELASNALGHTSPNPCVGCVIVDENGVVVGEGWHERAGEPHAEVRALLAAGNKSIGGTAYVSLEPCNHYGRTPPCTLALIRLARLG
jgi:diaminohydroxyphosphoribosylaminopyrimidine deaminase / 5-amino-6-(5-phosphoribosylamino)uracil reductase